MRAAWQAIWTLTFVVFAGLAQAQTNPDAEFDARSLSWAEKRLVQAALAFSGDYVGLLDGEWGNGSQLALETYTQRTAQTRKPRFAHVRVLLAQLENERLQNGWDVIYLDGMNFSYVFPLGFLFTDNAGEDVLQFASDDDRMGVVITSGGFSDTRKVHFEFLDQAVPGTETYGSYLSERMITAVTLTDGVKAYVRSDLAQDVFMTVAIVAAPEHRSRLALLSGSMQRGNAPDLTVPPGGPLASLMAPPVATTAAPPPVPPQLVPDVTGTASGTGTGFFINNTDLVTAAHVIAGCGRMELASGAVVQTIATNDDLDLAVLSSPERSAIWLELGANAAARLGEPVTALGYPYLGQFGQGLTVTGGNVSALPGGTFGETQLMISAPVQPGNSGGPLLNGDGAVIGVVVARINDMVVFEETGTLPQNMNFAVTNGTLTDFLKGANVLFPAATGTVHDMAKGVPDAVSGAVVPLFCFE